MVYVHKHIFCTAVHWTLEALFMYMPAVNFMLYMNCTFCIQGTSNWYYFGYTLEQWECPRQLSLVTFSLADDNGLNVVVGR